MGTEAAEHSGEVENAKGISTEDEQALRTVIYRLVSEANFNRDTYLDILERIVEEFDASFSPEKAYLKDLVKEELMKLGSRPKEPYLKKLVKEELKKLLKERKAEAISKRKWMEKRWEEKKKKNAGQIRSTVNVTPEPRACEGESSNKTVPNMWAHNLNRRLAASQAFRKYCSVDEGESSIETGLDTQDTVTDLTKRLPPILQIGS